MQIPDTLYWIRLTEGLPPNCTGARNSLNSRNASDWGANRPVIRKDFFA